MKSLWLFSLTLVGLLTSNTTHGLSQTVESGVTNKVSVPQSHPWRSIAFEADNDAGSETDHPGFRIENGTLPGNEPKQMILNLCIPREFFQKDPAMALARLHRANGEVIDRSTDRSTGSNREKTRNMRMAFPWGPNELAECWMEVTLETEHYWLEIPYGFDRDPNAPLPAPSGLGGPKTVSAMTLLTAHDHVLGWKNVFYDIKKLNSDLDVSLVQSSPFECRSKLILSKRTSETAEIPWDLFTPKTSVQILDAEVKAHAAKCIQIQILEDVFQRVDSYKLEPFLGSDTRSFGNVQITVGSETVKIVVPSSLYKFTHSHALKAFIGENSRWN